MGALTQLIISPGTYHKLAYFADIVCSFTGSLLRNLYKAIHQGEE